MSEKNFVTCSEIQNLYSIRRDRHSVGTEEPHRHPFWELILFESGEGSHIINGVTYSFGPHDIALLAPSDIHDIVSKDGTCHDCIKVGFTYDAYTQHMKDIGCFDHFPVLASLNEADYKKAELLLDMLYQEYHSSHVIGTDVFAANLLEQLVILIARNLSEQKNAGTVDDSKTRKILLYIQQHFAEPITLDDAAKALNYSPKYFGKLFIKEVGVPFQDYLKSLRLNYAYHLIQYSDQPITDICFNAGFRSPTYFSKTFKQKYGISPNHLRRQKGSP